MENVRGCTEGQQAAVLEFLHNARMINVKVVIVKFPLDTFLSLKETKTKKLRHLITMDFVFT